jgi:hypothetical protein
MTHCRASTLSLIFLVTTTVLAGCGGGDTGSASRTARDLLDALVVEQSIDDGSYDRLLFGNDYVDADNDCEDTRDEILIRDSQRAATGKCEVDSGYWQSDYEAFSASEASEIEVDHLVALKEAWISGASEWSEDRLERYFNDLDFEFSLSLMSEKLNQAKGSKDPSTWLPAQAICEYVVRWVAVKYRWNLSVDADEKSKIEEILSEPCGETRVNVTIAE